MTRETIRWPNGVEARVFGTDAPPLAGWSNDCGPHPAAVGPREDVEDQRPVERPTPRRDDDNDEREDAPFLPRFG